MKKPILILLTLFISDCVKSQILDYNSIENAIINLGEVENENDDFNNFPNLDSILKGVEIVMLGEQSHGEATVYDTKIKLIKYLHQELGFDLLIFESGFYDCNKAWQQIEEGENVRDAMGKSIFSLWSTTKDLKPLADYLEVTKNSDKPLQLYGFDNQLTGKYSAKYFLNDLSEYFNKNNSSILETDEWRHFSENITLLTNYKTKELKKNEPTKDLTFINI